MIDYSFYVYLLLDMAVTARYQHRHFGHNSHTYIKQLQKTVLFLSIRVGTVYQVGNFLSQQHLENRASPVLARQRNNPGKSELIDKIN